jgi:hypothetical protein
MDEMEHMRQKWTPQFDNGTWHIVADYGWCVAGTIKALPGDLSGEKTCRAICDAHNTQLEKENTT